MMKKTAVLLLAVLMVLTAVSCGNTGSDEGALGAPREIIKKIYREKSVKLSLQTDDIDITEPYALKYDTGISDASKIKEAAVSEPKIGSQAYSLVVVRVKDATDAEEIAREMLDGIDTGKWICNCADELRVAVHGDVVMLIMLDSAYGVSVDEIVDAFRTICGGNLDFVLKK